MDGHIRPAKAVCTTIRRGQTRQPRDPQATRLLHGTDQIVRKTAAHSETLLLAKHPISI